MRQRRLVLVRSTWGEARRVGLLLGSLMLMVTGCASHSLMPKQQAAAVHARDRALAQQADAIQAAIRQSGETGALAFLDATDGRLVVWPGETPADAWARHAAPSPDSPVGRTSVPAVLTFVRRADVPNPPETVTLTALQQQQSLRSSLAALESELRDAHRRIEERLGTIQREFAESVAAMRQETDRSLVAAKEDTQHAVASLAQELAAARSFMLQTAQLGWLDHELNLENASGIRKMSAANQELAAASARLASTMQQLSESLATQLKELATRLDTLQNKLADIK